MPKLFSTKLFFWTLTSWLVTSLILTSCEEEKTLETYIPLDAGAIVVVHASEIATKLLFEKIGDVDISNVLEVIGNLNIYQYPSQSINSLFEEPTSLGIDMLSDFYFFMGNDTDSERQFAVILFKMRNPKKFYAALKDGLPDSLGILFDRQQGINTALFPKDHIAVGWNQQVACMVLSRNDESYQNLEEYLLNIFDLSNSQSIMGDANFRKLLQKEIDISMYVNPDNLQATAAFVPTAYLNRDVKYLNAFFNFGRGVLNIDVYQYLEGEDLSLYYNVLDTNRHTELFSRVDEQEMVGFLNFRYNKGIIPKLIEAYKLETALKALSLTLNMKEKDFLSLTKGDMMVIFFGEIESMQEVVSFEYDKEFNKIERVEVKNVKAPGFVAEIMVNKKMEAMLENFEQQGLMKKDSGIYNLGEITGFDTYFTLKEGRLLVTTDERFLQKVKRRLIGGGLSPIKKLGMTYPISGYLDLHLLEEKFPSFGSRFLTGAEMASLTQVVNHFSFYVDPLQSDVIHSQMKIAFTDREKSSLAGAASLLEFLRIASARSESNTEQ